MRSPSATEDVIIIGAGPAGLTAAIYLGRFRRRCLVVEDDRARARWIPTSHNIPGFTAGVGGMELLGTLRAHALKYGAHTRRAHVSAIARKDDGFALSTSTELLYSRYVLLATGVRDHLPAIPGASEAVIRSLLRFCPICDAYEAIDKRIAILGDGPLGEREAGFLKHYSAQVTLLQIGPVDSPSFHSFSSEGIERLSVQLSDLTLEDDRVSLASSRGNRHFDVLYLALGCSPQHDLARSLLARTDEHGALLVNAHQETSVPGLYAAGDVVRGLNQVVVAAAESAIAATDIHNKLRANPL
jgi:thioredoxin reductase (NADPH)